MVIALAEAKKGSTNLWKSLETAFIRHRKAINALGYSQHIARSYISIGHASQLLIAAMEDPNIEVVEKNIPRMGDEKKKKAIEHHHEPEIKKLAH
jgi:hypothetical protein